MSKEGDEMSRAQLIHLVGWIENLDRELRELHDRINDNNRAVDSKVSRYEFDELRAKVGLLSAQVKQMVH